MPRRLPILLATLLLLGLPLRAQQPPAAKEADAPSPMQILIRGFSEIEAEHRRNLANARELRTRLDATLRLADPEEFITQGARLQEQLAEAHRRLAVERDHHIAFKAQIDAYRNGRQVLAQENAYLGRFLGELALYGKDQQAQSSEYTRAETALNRKLAALPPPSSFVNRFGITMVLVTTPKMRPFYASAAPVTEAQARQLLALLGRKPDTARKPDAPCTDLTNHDARACAEQLSRSTGFRYRLPNRQLCLRIRQARPDFHPAIALWLDEKWNAEYPEKNAIVRFGMTFATIWDPDAALEPGAGGFARELPDAHYPALGFLVVTDAAAGREARMLRLRTKH